MVRPFNGINYCRLKQIDFDGGFKYSKIITAAFSRHDEINIYPNPVKDFFKIKGIEEGKIKIIDSTGKIVKETSFFNSTLNISQLKKGIYSIQIFSEQLITTKKLIKK